MCVKSIFAYSKYRYSKTTRKYFFKFLHKKTRRFWIFDMFYGLKNKNVFWLSQSHLDLSIDSLSSFLPWRQSIPFYRWKNEIHSILRYYLCLRFNIFSWEELSLYSMHENVHFKFIFFLIPINGESVKTEHVLLAECKNIKCFVNQNAEARSIQTQVCDLYYFYLGGRSRPFETEMKRRICIRSATSSAASPLNYILFTNGCSTTITLASLFCLPAP